MAQSVAPGEGAKYSDDSMTAPTSDGQTVTVDATVLFRINKNEADTLFQEVGPQYIEKIVLDNFKRLRKEQA